MTPPGTGKGRRASWLPLALAVALTGIAAAMGAAGWRLYIVYGGSMMPTFPPGTLAVVAPPGDRVRPGDIIVFRDGATVTIHRVVGRAEAPGRDGIGGDAWITRGDANPVDDARPVAPEDILGRVSIGIPWLGVPLHLLRDHRPLLGAAAIMVALWAAPAFGRGRRSLPPLACALIALALAPLLLPPPGAASYVAGVRNGGNLLATAARHFLFSANLSAGTARQPEAPANLVATGANRSLLLDAGVLTRPAPAGRHLSSRQFAVADTFAVQAKAALGVMLRVQNGSPGTLPWADCTSYVLTWTERQQGTYGLTAVRPTTTSLRPGQTTRVDLRFRVSSSSPVGVFCGFILAADAARPSAYQAVPLRFTIRAGG